jgi:hypothetical protein
MIERFVKTLLFFVIIALLQLIIGPHAAGDSEHSKLLKKYLNQPMDVLIFGDSSNWYTAETDTDKRSISRMVKDLIPQYRIKSITHAAYHLGVYAALCEYIVRQKKHPRVIIIPINLRSFSPEWDKEPHYQFAKEKTVLEGGLPLAFYQPLRVLKYKFDTLTRKEYLDTPVFNGHEKIGTIKQMKSKKNQFILKYMYALSRKHRKIKSLGKIPQLLSRHNITTLFYLTPIDRESGELYLPNQFTRRVKKNITLIDSLLKESGRDCYLADLSLSLKSRYFAWQKKGSVNEHLNQEGRRFVAEKLAETLKGLL